MTDSTTSTQRERELKFDVPAHWVLPDTTGLSASSVSGHSVTLTSVYYDTEALDLLTSAVTLRQRTGGFDDGWQLKIPDGDARLELAVALDGSSVPKALQKLTYGVRRGAPLRPVAQIRTHRATQLLLGDDGAPLAELALDDVTATRTGESAVITSWREVEVELKQGDEKLLRRAAKLLRSSGASPAESPSKLARTLEQQPAGSVPVDTVGAAVRAYLAEQHDVILRGDIDLRREQDVIHRTRVATRRYRSVLRVFADLFDADRAAVLDAELKWYASALGRVRDLQVLGRHLHAQLDDLPPELVLGPVRARLDSTLQKDEATAWRALATAMRSRRYVALLDELRSWSDVPPLVDGSEPLEALAAYLNRADKKFRRRLKHATRLDERDPAKNEASHRARKAAKRNRYIAELAEPVLGKRAKVIRKRAKTMQSELGRRQDAVVAVDFLRRTGARAGTTAGENGFTFGILLMREAQRGGLDLAGT